jgi:hypothetical protein
MSVGTQAPILKPLKIKCTQSDCGNDLHCFLQKTQRPRPHGGPCRSCGEDLIDFPRVQARNLGDLEHTFECLSKEWIRHHFWHRPFDQHAINHARRKGMLAFRTGEAAKRIRQSVGKTRHPMEGKQTPFEKNVLFYAQHATAACCRKCIEYWHGIPTGRPLADDEVSYLAQLALRYVERRLPTLNEQPMKVPPITKAKPARASGRVLLAKTKTDSRGRLKAKHG